MKFKVLDRITHLAGYNIHENDVVIKEVVNSNFDDLECCRLFKAELYENVAECNSIYQSRNLFKHYLTTLDEVYTWTISDLFDNYHSWSSNYTITPKGSNQSRAATDYEQYLMVVYDICTIILNELELAVWRIEIDLLELCNELKKQKMLTTIDQFCELSRLVFLKNDNTGISPIIWLKSEQALRQLIEALKENGLIQERDTEAVIQHFMIDSKEPSQTKLEPINWLKSKALLAYLIDQLTTKPKLSNPFIDSDKKWEMTKLHFVVKNKPILRSLINDLKQTNYPNGCTEIDTIINKLS